MVTTEMITQPEEALAIPGWLEAAREAEAEDAIPLPLQGWGAGDDCPRCGFVLLEGRYHQERAECIYCGFVSFAFPTPAEIAQRTADALAAHVPEKPGRKAQGKGRGIVLKQGPIPADAPPGAMGWQATLFNIKLEA